MIYTPMAGGPGIRRIRLVQTYGEILAGGKKNTAETAIVTPLALMRV
jgi:hypothetical protein